MQWSAEAGAGFTTASARPWLPLGAPLLNVEAQRDDPSSVLTLVRDLIALRRELVDLRDGAYETIPSPEGTWVWRRGERIVVALNLTDAPVKIEGLAGTVRIATVRDRDGERVAGGLELATWTGALLERSHG
jgi:glycosidase